MTDFEDGADTLMTTAEVAALLRVKERKIYELVSENQIPHTKVTGKLLFPKALVRDWIKSGTSTAGARSHVERPLVAAGGQAPQAPPCPSVQQWHHRHLRRRPPSSHPPTRARTTRQSLSTLCAKACAL